MHVAGPQMCLTWILNNVMMGCNEYELSDILIIKKITHITSGSV